MKKLALSLSLVAVIATTPALAGAKVGDPMPAFSATSIDGVLLSNETLEDQTYVLEWTNDGCPFVKKHYNAGNMQATQTEATEAGAVWIQIISSAPGKQGYVTPEQARELNTSRDGAPTHVVLDEEGTLGKLFGAKTTPHMYIADRTDTLRYAGAIDSIPSASIADIENAENYVISAITAINAGEEIETRQSKPYGCSVKYK